jgi:hypothetical protein
VAAPKVVYYKSEQDVLVRIPPPAAFLNKRDANGRLAAPTAQFIVTYTNFPAPAQQAFQHAVDIWSTLIVSSVPIRIQANWVSMQPNLLGSAGPGAYRYAFDGGQKTYAFYPIALAEKIARRELNSPTEPDIVADFNRNNDWYYGTDGLPPKGQSDLVTVVLHELCHALGFIGFFDVAGDYGRYSAGLPSIYDYFIENADGKRLVNSLIEYPNNSAALKSQLAGNNLYLNGPILRQRSAQRIRIQAKYTYDKATSLYHLNDDDYPLGNLNALMTPQLGRGVAMHSPGPLVMNFFSDLEWKTTSVLHDPLQSSEDVKDLVFSTRVTSDTTLIPGSVQVFYRKSTPTAKDSVFTAVTPNRVGTTDEYRFTLPSAQAQGDVWYYFQAKDASGRTFTNPGKLPTGAQAYYHIIAGPDNTPPTIQYSPGNNYLLTTVADSLPIFARISDDRPTGISETYIEYQINGTPQPNIPLRYGRLTIGNVTYDSIYVNRLTFPANSLKTGDKIMYRIVARDGSRAKNQTTSPASGFYTLTVIAPLAVRDQYINNFSNATADFAGNGFNIATPTNFVDPAIHSDHPYQNGTNFQGQSDYQYILLSPIRVKANPDSAIIRFDEIVLVEPGDPGSQFGDSNFRDYVIVEGSDDNGRTWKPLLDGYNSNAQADWKAAYNRSLVTGSSLIEQNSATLGHPAFYKHREIRLLGQKTLFQPNEEILIRFRLVADVVNHGWGWAIDNLRIQAPPLPLVLGTEPVSVGNFSIYPNPVTNGLVQLNVELTKPVAEAALTVNSSTGQILRQFNLKMGGTKLSEQLDLRQLPAGLYFVKLLVGEAILNQKLIIAK